MSGIQRYEMGCHPYESDFSMIYDDNGDYVRYEDHAVEIARLRAEADSLRRDALSIAQVLAWQCFGECRGFSDGLLAPNDALKIAKRIRAAMGADA